MSVKADSQYFPCVNYIYDALKSTDVIFCGYDRYEKASFFNRCKIIGSNGVIDLSVPLAGGRNQKAMVKDVEISYGTKWQEQHWRSIESCYRKSPFFEYYAPTLHDLIMDRHHRMIDLNLAALYWLVDVAGLKLNVQMSQDNMSLLDQDLFLKWQPKNHHKPSPILRYPQVFEERTGFVANLSILDALFCVGPGLKELLKEE